MRSKDWGLGTSLGPNRAATASATSGQPMAMPMELPQTCERFSKGTNVPAPASSPWQSAVAFSLCSVVVLKAKVTTCEMGLARGCQVSQGMKKCWVCCRPAPCCLWRRQQGTRPPQLILALQRAARARKTALMLHVVFPTQSLNLNSQNNLNLCCGNVSHGILPWCGDSLPARQHCCHLHLSHSLCRREERKGACRGCCCPCRGNGGCVLQPRVSPAPRHSCQGRMGPNRPKSQSKCHWSPRGR